MTKEEWFNESVSYAKPDSGLDYYWAKREDNLVIESVESGGNPSVGFERWLGQDEFPITYEKAVTAGVTEFGISKESIDECLEKRFKQSQGQ